MVEKGRTTQPLQEDSIQSMPGVESESVEYYNIVPDSLIVIKKKPRYDSRGCVIPEPPVKKIKIDVYKESKDFVQTVQVNWPTNGIVHLRDNPRHYRVRRVTKGYTRYYEIEAKPGSEKAQEIASMQEIHPMRSSSVMSKAEVGVDIFGTISQRLDRLKRKVKSARDDDIIDNDYDENRMTKVGDPGAMIRMQSPDLLQNSEGDPVSIDNPLDEGIAKAEMAVGNMFKLAGDISGFKNLSKAIKHSIHPQEMQWSDWLVNPMTKFLPSTAVKPIKTWMRAIAPSALTLGMIAVMKHTLNDIKTKMPPQPNYTGQAKTSGPLGDIEDLENEIRS